MVCGQGVVGDTNLGVTGLEGYSTIAVSGWDRVVVVGVTDHY